MISCCYEQCPAQPSVQHNSRAEASAASSLAIAGLPQVMQPGKAMIAAAIGRYNGETSFAVGLSKSSGDFIVKGAITINQRVGAGGYVGGGFAF